MHEYVLYISYLTQNKGYKKEIIFNKHEENLKSNKSKYIKEGSKEDKQYQNASVALVYLHQNQG